MATNKSINRLWYCPHFLYTLKTHTHTRDEFRSDQLANCIRHRLYNELQAPPLSEGNPQPPPRWGLIQLKQFTTIISLLGRLLIDRSLSDSPLNPQTFLLQSHVTRRKIRRWHLSRIEPARVRSHQSLSRRTPSAIGQRNFLYIRFF